MMWLCFAGVIGRWQPTAGELFPWPQLILFILIEWSMLERGAGL